MDNKEFYDMVKAGIEATLDQGYPCVDEKGDCVYSDKKGGCCIVGAMMPDEETRLLADQIEGDTSFDALHYNGFDWAQQFTQDQVYILNDLQLVHDACSSKQYKEDFYEGFKRESQVILDRIKVREER